MSTSVLIPSSERTERAAALAAARSHVGVVGVLLAAAGVAWWSTAVQMSGMDAGVLLALALALLIAADEVAGLVVPGGSSAWVHSMSTIR